MSAINKTFTNSNELEHQGLERRSLLKAAVSLPLLAGFSPIINAFEKGALVRRTIPTSGEAIPAVGMGSYQTFNVAADNQAKQNLVKVLKTFFAANGTLIDSSPMYGRSEAVIGELINQLEPKPNYFAASKVWTYGEQAGKNAIKETTRRMGVGKMDLMQVHNLRDWQVQLPTLQQMKKEGTLRYTGITTSFLGQYDDFEEVMKSQQLDFVQLNYNIKVREAEKRLLPLAQDKGMAVIVNMPYEKGRLFKVVKGKQLPEWTKEFD
ncbi:MAG: aldo/keto reductase, partial [Kangiellaceae bacterium]|nr:aldo/keto reductase [Kangiellaceae bacterium]